MTLDKLIKETLVQARLGNEEAREIINWIKGLAEVETLDVIEKCLKRPLVEREKESIEEFVFSSKKH